MAPHLPNLGYVTIGSHEFPIIELRLVQGHIRIQFALRGPIGPLQSPVTVYGEDGRSCWQGRLVDIPRIRAGSVWLMNYDMTIAEVYGSGTEVMALHYLE